MYEALKRRGRPGLVGGAAAGAAAAVITAPLDLLKTRAMLSDAARKAAPSFKGVLRAEGRTVFLSGVSLRIAYKICSSGLFFAGVETFKKAAPIIGRRLSGNTLLSPNNPSKPSRLSLLRTASLQFKCPHAGSIG